MLTRRARGKYQESLEAIEAALKQVETNLHAVETPPNTPSDAPKTVDSALLHPTSTASYDASRSEG